MFVYFQLFVYFSQKNHLEASNTKISQSKDVLNENLEYLRRSAVYLLSAVCLLFTKKLLTTPLSLRFLKASQVSTSWVKISPRSEIMFYLENCNISFFTRGPCHITVCHFSETSCAELSSYILLK